jgi:type II secretion system protein G
MKKGFTLIELLVVISIIGILLALSIFGLMGARESARDSKRKADIELIRSGIEIYKADCNVYPTSLGTSLVGDGSTTSCSVSNTYIAEVPEDQLSPTQSYRYWSDGITYEICASLEDGSDTKTCGGSSNCGTTCNYKVVNP